MSVLSLLKDFPAQVFLSTSLRNSRVVATSMSLRSHRQYKHASKPGRVTVAGKPGDDLAPGTLNSILKQSGIEK